MHYVRQFNINGVDTKQVACIELHGKPNAATEGYVGVLGIDVDSPIHDVYKCVAVNGSIYTWELLSSGLSIMSASVSGAGEKSFEFPYANLRTPPYYVVKVGDLIIDKEGYLYQIDALGASSCVAAYSGTQVVAYGMSAYELAKTYYGFEGTEEEWLESQKGARAFIRYSAYPDGTDFCEEWHRGLHYIGMATAQTAPTAKEDYEWSVFSGIYVGSGDMPEHADIQIDPDSEDVDYVVVQEMGDSVASVMSQKATTEAIEKVKGACSNPLKGSATGSAVRMDDVSPLEHEMAVKVRSKNLFDNDTSKIEQVTYTNSSGTPGSKYGYAIRLPIGTYTIHAEAIDEATKEGEYYIYLAVNTKDGVYKSSGSPVKLQKYTDVTFTIDDGDVLYLYNGTSKGLTETQALFALFNIQIEQGTTATAYTPFVDVSAAKVRRYGKNLLDASKFNAANTTINGITFEQMGEGKVHVYGTIADNSKTILYASNVIKAANAKYISSGVYSIAQHAVGSRYVYMLARLNDANNKFLVNLQNENQSITTGGYLVGYSISVDRNITTPIDLVVDLQVEQGKNATAFEAFVESTEHTPNADGTVEGVTSLSPTTTLMTDTEGAVIDVEYNRDINKAFAELWSVVDALVGG